MLSLILCQMEVLFWDTPHLEYFCSAFGLPWSTLSITYNNSIVLSCIELILGIEVPKDKRGKLNHLAHCCGN